MNPDMLQGGNEIGSLVFDVGSRSFRMGYAQDDTPRADIPTAVGVSNEQVGVGLEPETKAGNRINKSVRYFTDVMSLCAPSKGKEVVNCLKDCMINDWDLFENLLDYSYNKCLYTDPKLHPVLFTEPPWNVKSKREKLTELMFEKYNVPAIFVSKNAVLAAFSSGRFTGMVVDSGATHTTAVPVFNGCIISNAVVKSPFGGDFVIAKCKQFFMENKIDVIPYYMVAQKTPVKENEIPIWTKKKTLPQVTNSWHNYMYKLAVEDFQHSVLQVSPVPYDENALSTIPTCHYEFPNGYNREFGSERFKIAEHLFDPNLNGSSMFSVSHIVNTSIGLCNSDVRPAMYNSIIVTGGNSFIGGFPERIYRDVFINLPSNTRLKLSAASGSTERRFGAWIGGSIIASAGTFQQMWFSRQEYNEGGKDKITSKCP